jgi:hypothetical protein
MISTPKIVGISIGAVVLIVIVIFLLGNVAKDVEGALTVRTFLMENKISLEGMEPPTITPTQAKGLAGRVINDVSWLGSDVNVYSDIDDLTDSDVVSVNNAFLEHYGNVYDQKYTNLGDLIKAENYDKSFSCYKLLDRMNNLFPNFTK